VGRKAKLKQQRKQQAKQQQTFTFKDSLTGATIEFSAQQFAVLAEQKAAARKEGEEIGQGRAIAFFLDWLENVEQIPGIGPKTAEKLQKHFIKQYGLDEANKGVAEHEK
jgi:predicted flap endonuclease-1-like 5' DNA nuclease